MITIKELTLDDATAVKIMQLLKKHEPEIWSVLKDELKQALNMPVVSQQSEPVCPVCRGKGYYTYGGSFGGSVMTQRCSCGANGG